MKIKLPIIWMPVSSSGFQMIQTAIRYAALGAVTAVLAHWRDSLGAVSSWGMIGVWVGMAFGAIFGAVMALVAQITLGISSRWMLGLIPLQALMGGVQTACHWAKFAAFLGALFGSVHQNAVIPVLNGPVSIVIAFGLLGMAPLALARLCRMDRWFMGGRSRVVPTLFSREITDLEPLHKDLATRYDTPLVGVVFLSRGDHRFLTITFSDSSLYDRANRSAMLDSLARDVATYARWRYASADQLTAIRVTFRRPAMSLIFFRFGIWRSFLFPIHELPGPDFSSLADGARTEPSPPGDGGPDHGV